MNGPRNMFRWLVAQWCGMMLSGYCVLAGTGAVFVERVPNEGIQPQAVVDSSGMTHLIYFKGNPAGGDIFYVWRRDQEKFSEPKRVNSVAGSAIAVGTIRGAQLCVSDEQVHVAWNGIAPRNGTYLDAPMLYTRLQKGAQRFDPERNLITSARGLDGGGSLAADNRGNVFVFWHAPQPGNTNGETGRALFMARSRDGGGSFEEERRVIQEQTGACGCCGMKAFVDPHGTVFALYRSASSVETRDEVLLAAPRDGDFRILLKHPWKINACPMSSASFASTGEKTFAAWETEANVYFTEVTASSAGQPQAPAGNGKRKYPSLAGNGKGEVLLAWTEGTAWGRGGKVLWQVFDPEGRATKRGGSVEGLPAWSMPAAVAQSDGSFRIFY